MPAKATPRIAATDAPVSALAPGQGRRQSSDATIRVRQAGPDHQVVTVTSPSKSYRRKPCSNCPWRVDSTGSFPAEAFRHSARTAYDMSEHVFACHQSGVRRSAICAGFLLRGAGHNLAVRLRIMAGSINPGAVSDAGTALHASYRAMAVANGVDPNDPVLEECR